MTEPIEISSVIQFKTENLRQEWLLYLTPQMQALSLYVARELFMRADKPMIITNVDSPDPKSPHHYGCAIDFRAHRNYYRKGVLKEVKQHINAWFPHPGKPTLDYHGKEANYHGHLQTPTWVLTFPHGRDPKDGPDHTN